MSIQHEMNLACEGSDIHQLEAKLNLNLHSPEFTLEAVTYGHRLVEELLAPYFETTTGLRSHAYSLDAQSYTIRTEGQSVTQLLPEHQRRVAEARRQIQYDYQHLLPAED